LKGHGICYELMAPKRSMTKVDPQWFNQWTCSEAKTIDDGKNPLSITIACAFFGSVLIGGMSMNKIAKFLSFDFLVFFGKYSYGMYIFNSILFHFTNLVFARNLPVYQRLLTNFGVFLLTIIASYLSYNLLEIKFIRLKERLSYS